MKILVCNDDGVYAEGILNLALSLKRLGEVLIVAPEVERSATGHAITIHHPLTFKKITLPGANLEAYSVNGTPADCVKIATDIILKKTPELIFSGINKGANLGTDVLYSGTVSAAIEGAILGAPSVAISLAGYDNMDYSYAGEIAYLIAQWILNDELPNNSLLNVNVPYIPKECIKGIRTTRLGIRKYSDKYLKRKDPRGKDYYWLAGEPIDNEEPEDTDIYTINAKYVSITPMHFDLTNYSYLHHIEHLLPSTK